MRFWKSDSGLVYDLFVLEIANKHVQEKLCTEPKHNPADALQFAIVFEDGLNRQTTYGYINQETKIKEEPVCSVSGAKQNNRECWRCGAANFTQDHLNRCKAPNSMCTYCGKKGHLEKVCNQKKSDNNQGLGKNRGFAKRVQLVDQKDNDDEDENYMVLNVEGNDNNTKLYHMEGFISGNQFKTMIDTGSPVTIYALDEIKKIMKRENLPVRDMVESERYVDFNGKPLQLLGYVFCELQVNESYIKKARILIAKKGTKSIIGREWLSTLNYQVVPEQKGELEVNSIKKHQEISVETKHFVKEFPKLFERRGKVTNHEVKINFKADAKITQQKGRRIPIQLQKAVDKEIGKLLKEGHIKKSTKQKMTYLNSRQ